MTPTDALVRPELHTGVLSVALQPSATWLALGIGGLGFHALVHVECPFRATTGWECPVCGGTRAFGNLVTGHPMGAIHDNALIVMFGAILVVGMIPGLRNSRLKRKITELVSGRSPFLWIALLIAWTLLRNLPVLAWLSPDR